MITLEQGREIFIERLLDFIDGKSVAAGSKILGIPERTLHAWIRKENVQGFEHLLHLSQKMNCSVDYLMGLKDY